MLRILGEDPADVAESGALLTELAELAELAGDARMVGEVAAMRAHRTLGFGHGEDALADAATAFAILTDAPVPAAAEDARRLSRALNGLVLVLIKLGVHELADGVSRKAIAVAAAHGTAMERLVHQLNRIRLQLSWALRLERGGRLAAAATRFLGAAETARAAGVLWSDALGRTPEGGRDCSIIRSAYALARPSADHLAVLDAVAATAHFTDDRIVLAIATARCLMAAHRRADAAAALRPAPRRAGRRPRPSPASRSPCTASCRGSRAAPTGRMRCRATPRRWRRSCGRCASRGSPRCAATPSTTASCASTAPSPRRRCRTRSPGCPTVARSTCGCARSAPPRTASRARSP